VSTTIVWSSPDAASCTASGAWSGGLANAGSQTVAPTTVGTETYTIVCTDSAGNSHPTSVALTVTAATVPAAPTLTLGSSTITAGGSTTITWSSSSATSCAAS